jgi:hypothetical protein
VTAAAIHARPDAYAAALVALSAAKDPLVALIDAAGARRGWWSRRRWRREHARFDPGADPWCTFVYETADGAQRLCVVELHDAVVHGSDDAQVVIEAPPFGWARISRFPADPDLPTLGEVLAGAPAARVIRYRPHRRCTLLLEGAAHARTPFAKVFADARGARIHAESLALWGAHLTGALGFAVARPGRWDERLRVLTQGRVDGAPVLATLHGPQGSALAARMGAACATLAVSALRPASTFDGAAQMARSARYGAELCRRVPGIAHAVDALLSDLRALHAAVAAREPRPIHGAPHAHQWLAGAAGLGLVDFDRHCLGDPELDVATFIAETDFEDRARVDVDAVNAAFVDAYERVAGPLDRRLLAAYRSHKRLAKALKAARAPRPDAAEKAARHVASARRCVEQPS